ncbi:membrane-associated guanylate kinase, WW and PDZ domain-containing protein 1 [Daktulosphaira vitifoliae]|uniref:membrane-associated guanylate kinase, WW and PDZ domain-containing protein 1 n=1 Tax=Daktulosphaira vitifoliae TaxID=58002 RepID=UPI0021AAEBBF|nr:membrane-associated guanylate kinase, WW and PDZ domain-containing protein 1 [Daktulosphaira vitifoliae]XP_050527688.1 membrane-associated guanylate kinase, WW and PDZ domain-containing protein 1 [Daktulosphaira vitifoliae]XP_050527689.1 membrane-associated guanylate kinase, WW and PDZ domain-containing protein 1 [Daktulosphaira vitifoliae]
MDKNIEEKFEHSVNNSLDDYLNGPSNNGYNHSRDTTLSDTLDLGPLPPKWEKAYTKNGEVYFIDHNSSTSHWLDPRLSKFQKKQLEDCSDDELPYGWERIDDPLYGTYYIDHVNRQTQYENPVLQAKNAKNHHGDHMSNEQDNITNFNCSSSENINSVKRDSGLSSNLFTTNPHKLVGERIHSTLVKSIRGLGFTIVGGDDTKEEFLQIKSVVPNGPAWLEGKLQMGDVLVYVNDKCVLGYTHHDMVSVFQAIAPGETVCLEVCRGYPLPFDPNDPNTEVVTTVAVGNTVDRRQLDDLSYVDRELYMMKIDTRSTVNDLCNQSVKSMPDLYAPEEIMSVTRPSSTDLILEEHLPSPLYLTMTIVKGVMGFGFTIADSAYGQKVKKILDKQRCQELMEGDILIDINNISVRNMSHNKVVQVLKDCQINEAASIIIQRYAHNSPEKFRGRNKKIDSKTTIYRSKTPSFDNYGDRAHNSMTNRSKTPINDNRSQISIQNNRLENGSEDTYVMTNNSLTLDNYHHRNDNNWVKINSSSSQICSPNTMYNGVINHANGHYVNTKQPQHYTNQLSQSIQNMSYEHYELNASKNEVRYLHNNNEISQFNQEGVKPSVSYITLQRQECGFGFRIVGGKEEGSQVSVGHIVPGGSADLDGRIMTGDEIISIDGQSTLNTSHDYVINLMGQAARNGSVTLGINHIKPDSKLNCILAPPKQHIDVQYPYDVTLTKRDQEGFGFVVISSLNKGPTIGRIIEGSPAFNDGHIHLGDHVLAVNNTNITNLSHGDIVNMIKDSGSTVTLTIGAPNDDAASTVSLPISNKDHDLEEEQYHAIELSRGPQGFGFSIRGGREFQNMSLFVLQIAENGPAALDSRLRVGDHIIEINGINTKNMTHSEAIDIIHSGGSYVRLLIRRSTKVTQLSSESNGFYDTRNNLRTQ